MSTLLLRLVMSTTSSSPVISRTMGDVLGDVPSRKQLRLTTQVHRLAEHEG